MDGCYRNLPSKSRAGPRTIYSRGSGIYRSSVMSAGPKMKPMQTQCVRAHKRTRSSDSVCLILR